MDQAVVGEGSGVDKAVVGEAVVGEGSGVDKAVSKVGGDTVADHSTVSNMGDVGDLGGRGQTHQGGDNESLKMSNQLHSLIILQYQIVTTCELRQE
jgi:hypothetical protein